MLLLCRRVSDGMLQWRKCLLRNYAVYVPAAGWVILTIRGEPIRYTQQLIPVEQEAAQLDGRAACIGAEGA